jgi:hypothetical protein
MSPRADPRNSLGGVDILEIEKGVPDAIHLKPKDRYIYFCERREQHKAKI